MVHTQKPTGQSIARFAPLWSCPFDMKSATYEVSRKTGVISGYMTLYDDPNTQQPYIDTYKDVVLPGCFNRTINRLGEARKNRGLDYLLPYLWQHDPKELLGGVKHLGEDSKGVIFENQLNLRVKRAEEALALMEDGQLLGISYGYDPIQAIPQNGLRYLKEARLHEVSSVTFPAHEFAVVTSIKSPLSSVQWLYDANGVLLPSSYIPLPETHKSYHFINFSPLRTQAKNKKAEDFTALWTEMKPDTLLSQFYTMLDAFIYALLQNVNDDGVNDKSGAVTVILSQFEAALQAWLPVYVEADAQEDAGNVMGDTDEEEETVSPQSILDGMLAGEASMNNTSMNNTDMGMGVMSAVLLTSFKNALQAKSGRVLSEATRKKLQDALDALKLTTDDLYTFVNEHSAETVQTQKATALLLAEIKNRLPLFQSSLATPSLPGHDENTVQLSDLTREAHSWLNTQTGLAHLKK